LGAWQLNLPVLLVTAVFQLVSLAINGLMGLVIVYALLSLVQPHSPLFILLSKLCEPFLQPLRRILPLIGGIDLSVFVAIMVFQIALMILKTLHLSAIF
jgi:YggT family protein